MNITNNYNFYGIAVNQKDSTTRVIGLESELRHQAIAEAYEKAREIGYLLETIYPVETKKRQGEVLTKFAAHRKRNNGNNPKNFAQYL